MLLKKQYSRSLLVVVLTFLALSCQSLKTAVYDQYSYQQAISLKVESDALIDQATNIFSDHEEAVATLRLELKKLVEYEKNKPSNSISYAMLQLMANEDRNLLAGFLKRWEDEEQLSEAFTTEAKAQIREAFDLIIKYEADKNKTNTTNILDFLED
ncbi:hypothetical protein ES676_09915 [Bizionia saleffrena]|uniref:Uncharacterized protein n=1 Tax=Bizionia saleffrena TaxID=291189 RepID=A0A8H2QL25_9FLAO|nr:hypothetical protein [Bizionia saleffrena]TYB73063.1 hypothetical protein ES676_09915 [Bizionia saleffrena]